MSEQSNPPAEGDEPTTLHSYDGIQEYDNPTPRWWDLIFVATIVFAPVYVIYFHAPNQGRTLAGQYEADLAENMRLQFGEIGDLTPDEPTILKYMGEEQWLKVGESTFKANCVSCHGRDAEGVSGPNLTDDYYINVKQIADIAKVVSGGAKNGAMPAWANRLHPNEIVLVSAYVASLRGENLPSKYAGDKGKEIAPWPSVPSQGEQTDGSPAAQ
ncbi:Cbb3-type cytochrome c oxidase subunit CcoP2 [Botrimarina colliarenosi]|uniref:Cbb3-type cytochrome c oxidase subunit CcoP2 n=1 Tax=Botrimarina colliarenosi TaxID=2528001 RepID=A0A5C6AD68_9BACT|nr:cbb3-type cytochrome c oxidase N-terminal domain-containing protein [Botrimarina colliarenosi]TWT97559.1 Cbb3-type cytochrome c oxidase subunit CcoP2 [Botrimarina colliarenosi]